MATQCMLSNYNSINQFIHAVTTNTMPQYIKRIGPYVAPEHVVMKPLSNMKSYSLAVDNNNILVGSEEFDNLLNNMQLSPETLTATVRSAFGEGAWQILRGAYRPSKLEVVQAISIEGNKESKFGKNIFYATNEFQKKRHRYDHVLVDIGGGETQPAQLMMLFQLHNHNRSHVQFFGLVRFISEIPQRLRPHARYACPFPIYEWEIQRGANRVRKFSTLFIDMAAIVGLAFVTPVFTENIDHPSPLNPKFSDQFWYIDKRFCDRDGWDNVLYADDIIPEQVAEVEAFIDLPHPLELMEERADDENDDDDYYDLNANSDGEDNQLRYDDTSSDDDSVDDILLI